MESSAPREKTSEASMEQIILKIRGVRDRQIDELMSEPVMMAFLEHYYNTVAISQVKLEFLKKDLIELKKTPLDLAFYSALITQVKESNANSVDSNHKLFLVELKSLFTKYGF